MYTNVPYNSSSHSDNLLIQTIHNQYYPDGNSSVLIALDSHLLGVDNYFEDLAAVIEVFELWFEPFEKRFNINFHVKNVTTFNPTLNDSLDDSIIKVPKQIGWNLSLNLNDPKVQGNKYDWLIIYQEFYGQGRNRVNSINGNALIIAHYQPLDWTSRQLILLHEIGHLFGAVHYEEGVIPPSWYYPEENYSIMSYDDLVVLHRDGWNRSNMPIDEHNFNLINQTKYRFDQIDAELDGLPNYYEFRHGLNPCFNDSLQDLDNDGLTNINEFAYGTNPRNSDSDLDGFSDWAETYSGTNPLNSSDVPAIYTPVIVSWTHNMTIDLKEPLILEWRAFSSNRDYYIIYKNETLQQQENWISELIIFPFEKKSTGMWNFTCIVFDQQGNNARATIFIQVITSQNTQITFFEIVSTFIFLGLANLIYKKKKIIVK